MTCTCSQIFKFVVENNDTSFSLSIQHKFFVLCWNYILPTEYFTLWLIYRKRRNNTQTQQCICKIGSNVMKVVTTIFVLWYGYPYIVEYFMSKRKRRGSMVHTSQTHEYMMMTHKQMFIGKNPFELYLFYDFDAEATHDRVDDFISTIIIWCIYNFFFLQ